ncbi:hypothetical protein CLOP_g8760 [Closterium sp. NIES-67]|nr:hypothetical protein CLOP_g7936 [Closterium sp. NIES-67]GJP78467.1 hypothetical protein CLOP_g8760 [Closterium sp. NIES-67]
MASSAASARASCLVSPRSRAQAHAQPDVAQAEERHAHLRRRICGKCVRERIIRAFLVEEQKIVKKVLKLQKSKEKIASKVPA